METAGIFASLSSSIVEYFLVIAGFFFAYCILVVYFEICANLWSKYMNLWRRGTWICRAMFFFFFFVTVISAISYGLIMLWMKDPKLVSCIYIVIFYCSTYFTGYKSDCKTEKKNSCIGKDSTHKYQDASLLHHGHHSSPFIYF